MARSRFFPSLQLSECEAHVQGLQMARKAPKTPRKGMTLPARSERASHVVDPLARSTAQGSRPLRVRKGVITPVVNPYEEHVHRVDGVRAPLKVAGSIALPATAYVATGIAVRGADPIDALFRGAGFA